MVAAKDTENALTVYGKDNKKIQALSSEASRAIIAQYLAGSDLTFDRLLMDLAGMMTVNWKIAKCDAASLFNSMVFAARHQMTFGDGGIWIIPRREKKGGGDDDDSQEHAGMQRATPQLSSRGRVSKAKDAGVERIEVVLVYEGDTVTVHKTNTGLIEAVEHDYDILKLRDKQKCRGGFGVALFEDGRSARVTFYTREDLDRRMNKTASRTKQGHIVGPWIDDTEKMWERSIRSAVATEIVGDFTRMAGQMGSLALPEFEGEGEEGEVIDVQGEPVPDSSAAAAEELLARGGEQGQTDPAKEAKPPSMETPGDQPSGDTAPPPSPAPPTEGPPIMLGVPTAADLPNKLRERIEAGSKDKSVLVVTFDKLCRAYASLPEEPKAVRECWVKNSQEWGREVVGQDGYSLSGLRIWFFERANKDGFPQEG